MSGESHYEIHVQAHFGSAQLGKAGVLDDVEYKVVSDASGIP